MPEVFFMLPQVSVNILTRQFIVMSVPVPRSEILSIYKKLLRESQKFTSYNFKMYALRKIRDAFKEGKTANEQEACSQYEFAKKNLDIIRRQIVIGDLYSTDKLVIEK